MQKVLILSRVDREDFWILNGMVFDVSAGTYQAAIAEISVQLKSEEIINYIRSEFDYEQLGELVDIECSMSNVTFLFKERELRFQADFAVRFN